MDRDGQYCVLKHPKCHETQHTKIPILYNNLLRMFEP